jgi:hypothetical protein
MKILPQQEAYIRGAIRDELALNPLVTIRQLQRNIRLGRERDRIISDKYLMKLLHKVRREIVFHSDRKRVSARLTEISERCATMQKQLLLIAYWQPEYLPHNGIKAPRLSDRINAIRTITQLDLMLLRAELDVGMYEDRRASLEEMLRQGLLPQELHEQVVGVFRTWKLQPSPTLVTVQ